MISRPTGFGVAAITATVLLTACGGSESQPFASSGLTEVAHRVPFLADRKFPGFTGASAPFSRPDRRRSWISPDVKRATRIAFVSDYATGDVEIFSLPSLTLKGTLTGFSGPQGECTDGSNIWIVNTNTSQVFKYSRTGTLLGTINDPGEYPAGCAVNRSNGDVVVSNILSTYGGPGNLELFKGGTGNGIPLYYPYEYQYFFPTYDSDGNIYADGMSSSASYLLFECSAGSYACKGLTISGATLYFPGGLNWDRVNNEIVLGDQECGGTTSSCWYAATISGSTVTVTGKTTFLGYGGSNCDVTQGALGPFSKFAVGGCTVSTSVATVDRWPYPAGGTPTNYGIDLSEPIGAAISSK